ncbi:MAG: hypothetical protein JWP04_914 [Belnapia sp.]|nr:hypothetical protein [Belnapia sp.]
MTNWNEPKSWNEPYLETCCRAALHRLSLVGAGGRPDGLPSGVKDGPCLARLGGMGLARLRDDGRHALTAAGAERHASEILRREPAERGGRKPAS